MTDLQKAQATQIRNIEARTGKTLDQLTAMVQDSGLARHGEVLAMLKSSLGLGHGDANLIAHLAKAKAQAPEEAPADPLDALYSGPKAALRVIHEALLPHLDRLGAFEAAPKQKYISYRRKKQFATIGPATQTRVEVGLNHRDLSGSPRLEKLPAGQMCSYRVKLTRPDEVDAELVAWIKSAYEAAG